VKAYSSRYGTAYKIKEQRLQSLSGILPSLRCWEWSTSFMVVDHRALPLDDSETASHTATAKMTSIVAVPPPPPSWLAPSWEQFNWTRNCRRYAEYTTFMTLGGDNTFPRGTSFSDSAQVLQNYIQSALPANYTPVPTHGQLVDWHLYFLRAPAGPYRVTGNPVPEGFRDPDRGILGGGSLGLPWFISLTVNKTEPACIVESCALLQQYSFLDKDVGGIGVGFFADNWSCCRSSTN
jgi:hypothetical protein